jgi:hypothetical protein
MPAVESADVVPGPEIELKPEIDEAGVARMVKHIEPAAALPAHLQDCSFDRDIWRRMRKHAVPHDYVERSAFQRDPKLDAFFNRVVVAASDRETEVLLHNQSRVFKEVLSRTVEGVLALLNTPPVPRAWYASVPAVISVPGIGGSPPSASVRKSKWKAVVAVATTPKWVLLATTVGFLVTSSYFKLQVSTLKSAIDSYKEAAGAAGELKDKLSLAVASAKDDRTRLEETVGGLNSELAAVRSSEHEKDLQLAGLRADKKNLEEVNGKLTTDLKKYQEAQAVDVKAKQAELDAEKAAHAIANVALAKADAEKKGLEDQIKTVRQESAERATLLSQQQLQIDGLRQANDSFFNQNAALQRDKTLLKFAMSFVSQVRRELGGVFSTPSKDTLRQYLNEFESAQKTVSGQ